VTDREWLARPAVRPISAASAAALRPFLDTFNQGRPYEQQLKPFGFLIAVQVWHPALSVPAGYPPERFQLIHPYEPDPQRWLGLDWIDHYSGHSFRIHTTGPPAPNSVKVKTNQDVLDRYRTHPEPKSLDPDGNPCQRLTHGLLGRRPVAATEIAYIGKEANRLEDVAAGLIHDPTEILNTYNDPKLDPWHILVIPALKQFDTAQVARLGGVSRTAVQRYLKGTQYPHRRHRQTLTRVAAELAAADLRALSLDPPRATFAVLTLYRDINPTASRRCCTCGTPIRRPRALYCGAACKKRAHRRRKETR
jgi:hypothetical protein